ncbi:MAG: monovalent cation/H+ antiporter complex subunit F [Anaerolineae bacterium]|jgi:multicomponent Na+:H+ antiporter subunit F|nr:monovalent cation/H+ antiporter complex subunit F [Anaerolineae bacterium]
MTSIQIGVSLALIVLVGCMIAASWRVFFGKTAIDRLQAVDLVTTILTAIVALLGVVQNSPLLIDLGIAFAAFSFVGTLAVARFIREGKVF